MNSIGENIKKFRKAKGLTQERLAELSGLSTMSVRRYETNERTPNIKQLRAISATLGVMLSDLTNEDREGGGWDIDSQSAAGRRSKETGRTVSLENAAAGRFYSENELILLDEYRKLNEKGQKKAKEYIYDLTEQPKYLKEAYLEETAAGYTVLSAAHARTDIEVTEEMRRADEKIMDDDNF